MAQISSKTTPEKIKRQGAVSISGVGGVSIGAMDIPKNLSRELVKRPDEEDMKHPWQTLVSYVDEITVGGRKNSKGQYIDAMGKFPGFGKRKEPKDPENCFPKQCYKQYVFIHLF